MEEVSKLVLDELHGFDFVVGLVFLTIAIICWFFLGANKREQKKLKRRIWSIGIVVLIGALIIGGHHLMPPKRFPSNVTGVLVLKIAGDNDGSLQAQIISSLDAELAKDSINQTIQIHGCDEEVDEKAGLEEAHKRAREIGKARQASLVVWGNKAGESRFFPRVTTVAAEAARLDRTLTVQDIHEVNLPSQVVNQPLYLAHFISGFSFSIRSQFDAALKHFEAALNLSEATSEESAFIHLMVGSIYSSELAQKQWGRYSYMAIEELTAASNFFKKAGWEGYNSTAYAMTELLLGELYRKRGTDEGINQAIAAYKSVLQICNKTTNPFFWARAEDELGVAFCDLSKGNKMQNVKNGIDAYEKALEILTKDTFPSEWAQIQSDLGYAYTILAESDPGDKFEYAISACQLALTVVSETNFPGQWAAAEHNLGVAYTSFHKRWEHDSDESLKKAIEAFQASLRIFTETNHPLEWAQVKMSLGMAYANLSTGNLASNLTQGINAEELALKVYTKSDFPKKWAKAYGIMAGAYMELPDREIGTTNALQCYTNALEVFNREDYPLEWAMTQCNLSKLCFRLPPSSRPQNFFSANEAAVAALTVFNEKDFPDQWAETEVQLGDSYRSLQNFQKAIDAYTAALRVANDEHSFNWASVQLKLGVAYSSDVAGDRVTKLSKAKEHFSNALKVWTSEKFPYQHGIVTKAEELADSELRTLPQSQMPK